MKKGLIIFFAIIFILAVSSVTSQEFSVRFFSFGKNATIDLKLYLGESEHYIVSKTENIIVTIDQRKGIAYLEAKPEWVGSEVVFFKVIEAGPIEERVKEKPKRIEEKEEEKEKKITPLVPETLKEKAVVWGENVRLFGGTVDSSVLELFESIKKEDIKKISKKVEKNRVEININDEVELNFETGYMPKASMNFSLGPKAEGTVTAIEGQELKTGASRTTIIIFNVIAFVIILLLIYLYINRSKVKQKYAGKRGLAESTIFQLKTLQRNLGASGSEEFLNVVRSFFSKYFGISYDFEFEELIKTIEESDADHRVKKSMITFVKALSKWMIGPGTGQIPERELKKLISTMRNILKNI